MNDCPALHNTAVVYRDPNGAIIDPINQLARTYVVGPLPATGRKMSNRERKHDAYLRRCAERAFTRNHSVRPAYPIIPQTDDNAQAFNLIMFGHTLSEREIERFGRTYGDAHADPQRPAMKRSGVIVEKWSNRAIPASRNHGNRMPRHMWGEVCGK